MNRFGRPARPAALPDPKLFPNHQIISSVVAGQIVYRLTPTTVERQLVYLHGGGYVQPISKFHWHLLAELSNIPNLELIVPCYGRSPKHNVNDALELMSIVLQQTHSESLLLAGDSAGGGLALALAQQPSWQQRLAGLALISPWVDSQFADELISRYRDRDPWLTPDALQYIANAWSGVGDYQRTEVSPLRGELRGLPKTLLFIGDHDLLYPDACELASKMQQADVALEFEDLAGGLHVYPLLPTPEGIAARKRLADWILRA